MRIFTKAIAILLFDLIYVFYNKRRKTLYIKNNHLLTFLIYHHNYQNSSALTSIITFTYSPCEISFLSLNLSIGGAWFAMLSIENLVMGRFYGWMILCSNSFMLFFPYLNPILSYFINT